MKEEPHDNPPVVPAPSNNANSGISSAAISLRAMIASLEKLSGRMVDMSSYMADMSSHMASLSSNMAVLSANMAGMSTNMEKVNTTLEKAIDSFATLDATLEKVHASLEKVHKVAQEPCRNAILQPNGNRQPQVTQQQRIVQQQQALQSQLQARQQQQIAQQLAQQQLAAAQLAAGPRQQASAHMLQPHGLAAATPDYHFWNNTQWATESVQKNKNNAYNNGAAGIPPMQPQARHVSAPLRYPLAQDQSRAAVPADPNAIDKLAQSFRVPGDAAHKRRRGN
ncbi:hypothetical protein QBC41DRAFT_224717 [Cercophora samala]|uniref:Uncharacterized protein n=1 Tax=Cercophora samala TaxID=330535 RepID=A0AA39ZDQ9_9PEZI|nr:hypothetical protein QBC41DRAFT_224717 [Cercophora samala]